MFLAAIRKEVESIGAYLRGLKYPYLFFSKKTLNIRIFTYEYIDITHPGVQYPHWVPFSSASVVCRGW